MSDSILTTDDLLAALDALLPARGRDWWDAFYADRGKDIPFFVNQPDESLVSWFENGRMVPGRALELGCGPGRNAIDLAKQGCAVDAVDVSETAIRWARERAAEAGVDVNFVCSSVFDCRIETAAYDIVHDSGCLHHLPPHRRVGYLDLVRRALKPTGRFGLTCFNPEGGADLSDLDVYRNRTMGGGLGYTEARLREVLETAFNVLEFRRMQEMTPDARVFGKDFLWVVLMQPRPRPAVRVRTAELCGTEGRWHMRSATATVSWSMSAVAPSAGPERGSGASMPRSALWSW